MSLDDIQLPAIIIQELYKNVLVDLQSTEPVINASTLTKISYLGSNQQQVVIVVNHAETIYLPEEELNFLLGILAACNLSMADVALINLSKNKELSYTTIAEQLKAKTILLFGVQPKALQLPLQFPNYQIQNYNDRVYLSAPQLKKLESDKLEKTKLWNCLKQLFAISKI